jgi:hypothetical protein
MRLVATLTVALVVWMDGSPARADDGGTGFWLTLWQPTAPVALVVLYGGSCALCAQNTGRNAWEWFLLGVFFSVIMPAALLYKNAEERRLKPGSSG